jgi:endonuclease YncB( thermonuclease family)
VKQTLYLFLFLLIVSSCHRKSGKRGVESNQYDYYIQVIGVSDGDTFKGLTQEKIEIRFRIYGIDAPEKKQPFSNKLNCTPEFGQKTLEFIYEQETFFLGSSQVYAPA